jgi:CRP/FNR family cyclic AMP-dependent transcriptional regulator
MRTSFGAELLGPGDILRPWQQDGDDAVLATEDTSWRVIAPTSFAVLDIRWAMRMAPWPALGCELVGRALERSLRLATLMAISQHRRLDARLRLLLWKLADRFGVVRRDGVHLEIPITHEALSLLCVARRPSVSTTLRRMAEAGQLRQEHRHIVLLGEPPTPEELELQSVDTKTFFSSV